MTSTGDDGVPAGYPSYSPNVVAVGGTTITLNATNVITSETGWSGSGGGISAFEPKPAYQNLVSTPSANFRTAPDVSFDANPSSGVAVFDTYNNTPASPWSQVGGTSFRAR